MIVYMVSDDGFTGSLNLDYVAKDEEGIKWIIKDKFPDADDFQVDLEVLTVSFMLDEEEEIYHLMPVTLVD